MRWTPLAIVVLAVAACREPADVPIDADDGRDVRVATFNVRRFFDTVCDSGACEGGDYEVQPTQAYFDTRADQLADAIARLGADVVALQEVETQACLDALLARLATAMPYGVLGEIHTAASVDVAVLSKTPIETVIGHRTAEPLTRPDGTTTVFSRELLEVHVHADTGAKVVVFAAHFRSKVNDDPGRRLAEAQVASRVVNTRAVDSPDALVILGGDLNDVPGSPPLDALTVDGGLVRVADDLPPAQQVTYVFNGRGQILDHLLLAPTPAASRVPRSTLVFKDGAGWGGSDHFALTSELRVALP